MAASSLRLRAPWLCVGILVAAFLPSTAISACIEYSDYIHWKSEVYIPDGGFSVAVAATESQACFASVDEFGKYFRTIDLSSSLYPVIVGTLKIPNPDLEVSGLAMMDGYAYLTGGIRRATECRDPADRQDRRGELTR